MRGSIIAQDDGRVLERINSPDVVSLEAWRPTYSVFHSNNQYLVFTPANSSYVPQTASQPITTALGELLSLGAPYSTEFALHEVDSLYASRSDTESNRHRWQSFTDFGNWAFHDHLPSTIGGTSDPRVGRDRLVETFQTHIVPGRGISGVRKQTWCGRYTARNSGISRRLAACTFLASNGDTAFTDPIKLEMRDERLDLTRLNSIRRQAASYVLVAHSSTHAALIELFRRLVVPVVSYGVKGVDVGGPIPHLYCLLSADATSPHVGRSNRDETLALHRQASRLRMLLENAKERQVVSDLSDYVRHVCECLARFTDDPGRREDSTRRL